MLFTSEPVKRKAFALGTAMALAKVLAVDVADYICYYPAPKNKRVAITDAHD